MDPKTHLGAGVYATLVNGQLVLTTEDGSTVTNTIVLEPEGLDALNLFLLTERMKAGGR